MDVIVAALYAMVVGYGEYMDSIKALRFMNAIAMLDFFNAVRVAYTFRMQAVGPVPTDRGRGMDNKGRVGRTWMDSFVSVFLGQFGGSIMTAMFITFKAPGWCSSLPSFAAMSTAWYLMFCCPYDLFFKLYRTRWVQWITIPCEAATSAHCILSFGVEAVWANANPNVAANPVAAVIAGTFLASGGGILYAWFNCNTPEGLSWPPPVLLNPSFAAQRGFFVAALYLVLRDPNHLITASPLCTKLFAHGLCSLIVLVLMATERFTPRGVSPLQPLGRLARYALNIPSLVPLGHDINMADVPTSGPKPTRDGVFYFYDVDEGLRPIAHTNGSSSSVNGSSVNGSSSKGSAMKKLVGVDSGMESGMESGYDTDPPVAARRRGKAKQQ